MTIVPQLSVLEDVAAIPLARYAQLAGIEECAFFGVASGSSDHACNPIWTLPQRKEIARYLYEAQLEIEQQLSYPLGIQWVTEQRRAVRCTMTTQFGKVIAGGSRGVSTIAAAAAVDHTSDPAVVGPIATTVTDADEVVIYHPGTTRQIYPSKITIGGGNVTIEIPICRMVKQAYEDNPDAGLDYSDHATWMEVTVDVKRVYNDPSTMATLVRNHACSPSCTSCGCADYTQSACFFIKNDYVGVIEVHPATYQSGSWNTSVPCCNQSDWKSVELNYQAGAALSYLEEEAIIHLAHVRMSHEPCACGAVQQMWQDDQTIPESLPPGRELCPFGLEDGAWRAWQIIGPLRLIRMSIFK